MSFRRRKPPFSLLVRRNCLPFLFHNRKVVYFDSDIDLDGGGVRSYATLLILKALMDEINSVIKLRKTADACTVTIPLSTSRNLPVLAQFDEQLRPRDIFDFIFGSSTGG
jgi:hypothetical protein